MSQVLATTEEQEQEKRWNMIIEGNVDERAYQQHFAQIFFRACTLCKVRLLSSLEMCNCCSLAASHNIQLYLVYTFMVGFEFTTARYREALKKH